jgi:uncharacterized membrane protein YdbT with pleckstrin-like domain
MDEEPIWKGTSSQWKNFKQFVLVIIVLAVCVWLHKWKAVSPWIYLLVVPPFIWAFWRWLTVKTTFYALTSERLVTTHGILTKVTDTLELYRVRDLRIVQPLFLRMLGLQNVQIITTDATTDSIVLDYLPTADDLGERLRKSVEDCRDAKRVRAMDIVNENPGDQGGDNALS